MPVTEAARLVRVISRDPSSQTFAEVAGMDHPVTREWLLLADLWDVGAQHTYKKPKPYPRPFKVDKPGAKRIGTPRSKADIDRLLRPNGALT